MFKYSCFVYGLLSLLSIGLNCGTKNNNCREASHQRATRRGKNNKNVVSPGLCGIKWGSGTMLVLAVLSTKNLLNQPYYTYSDMFCSSFLTWRNPHKQKTLVGFIYTFWLFALCISSLLRMTYIQVKIIDFHSISQPF